MLAKITFSFHPSNVLLAKHMAKFEFKFNVFKYIFLFSLIFLNLCCRALGFRWITDFHDASLPCEGASPGGRGEPPESPSGLGHRSETGSKRAGQRQPRAKTAITSCQVDRFLLIRYFGGVTGPDIRPVGARETGFSNVGNYISLSFEEVCDVSFWVSTCMAVSHKPVFPNRFWPVNQNRTLMWVVTP